MSSTNSRNIVPRAVLIAVLINSLATPAFAQQDFSGIPGLGSSIPPKVLIIFDTSNSMRDLPQTQQVPTYLPAPDPTFPDGGPRGFLFYRDDDWDVSSDAGTVMCHNRFCVGKRVLYSILPTYSDSIEMGLAGYYQYRTRFLGTGDFRCVYDVLAPPGISSTFVSSTSGLTSGVPPALAAACDPAQNALHTYNYTSTTNVGAAIACSYGRDYGATVNTGTSILRPGTATVENQVGAAPCSATDVTGRTLTRGMGANVFNGGSMGNSRIFMRMAKGSTTCPATAEFAGRPPNSSDRLFPAPGTAANGPSNYNGGAGVTPIVSQAAINAPAIRDTNIAGGLSPPGVATCTPTNPCTLIADAPTPVATDDAGLTIQVYGGGGFGVAAPAMTIAGTPTYTRQSGPVNSTFNYQPVATAAACVRPDGGTASIGDEYFVPTGNLSTVFAAAPAFNCSNPAAGREQGCRVVATNFGSAMTAGTLGGAPAGTIYQAPTGPYPGTCTVACSGTSAVNYSYNSTGPNTYTFNRLSGASCSSLNQTGYTGAAFPPAQFATPATPCNGTTPCTIQNAMNAANATRSAFNNDTTSSLESVVLSGTVPPLVTVDQSSYVASCPAAPSPTTSATFGCSVGNPCEGITTQTPSPVLDGGTAGPANQFRINNDNATIVVSTVTYTQNGSSSGTTDLAGACPVPAGANYTMTSGSVAGVTCGSVVSGNACRLTNAVPLCGGIPCTSDTFTSQNGCRFGYTRYTYVAPRYGVCRYQRQQWDFTQSRCSIEIPRWNLVNPTCQANCPQCTYRVQAWTYFYEDPYPYCRYYATVYPYTGTTAPTYNYTWNTKGGEYLGSFEHDPAPQTTNYCSQPGSSYPSYRNACPEEISSLVNGSHPRAAVGQNCSAGRKCLLRWRNASVASFPTGRTSYASAANRFSDTYQNYTPTTPKCLVPDRDGGETVMPSVATYAANPSNSIASLAFLTSNAPAYDFCRPVSGAPANEIRIRADWFDPGMTNTEATIPANTISTRTGTKMFGLSIADGGAAQTFVPIASNNLVPIQQALGRCILPESDAGLTSPLRGGLCMAETGIGSSRTCNGAACQNTGLTGGRYDFTPLVGSLSNARDYLAQVLANDPEFLCREYYVLLVSDGLEDTPRNFTQINIRDAVGALRNPNPTGGANFAAAGRDKDVKTFVIGFGAGLGGSSDGGAPTDLDVIARTGGTAIIIADGGVQFNNSSGYALNASSQGQLESALSLIFNNITGGSYSRSRPTLTSDGTRLYHAFFERGSPDGGGSPEWKGNLLAYTLPVSGGSLIQAWEHRPILDSMTPVSRDLVAFVPLDGGLSVEPFSPSNSALTNYIDAVGTYSNEGAASVSFARNDSLGELFTPIAIPRRTRVGAMVFSSPVAVGRSPFGQNYGGQVGEPSRDSFNDASPDGGYRGRVMSRPVRVLLGGNDGLWRGVVDRSDGGSADGTEAWGIVPGRDTLKLLPTTRRRALPLVDGTTAVAEVCWPSSGTNAANCTATDWRAVAVIALRQGGESYTAVELKNDGSRPTPLWTFDDSQDYFGTGDDLALTYAPPLFGRVEANGQKRWVAFFGGGQAQNSTDGEGDSIYVVDAQTGVPSVGGSSNDETKFDNVIGGGCEGRLCPSLAGRPASWRREDKTDTDSVYMGSTAGCDGATAGFSCSINTSGGIWAMRTRPTGNPRNDWRPRLWWDPFDSNDGTRADGQRAPIWVLDKTTGLQTWPNSCRLPLGSGGAGCNVYDVDVSFYNRPRLAALTDSSSLNARPDMYIGTGDANNLNNATEQNFFFAIHDRGFLTARPTHDGEALWAYAFDPGEKVTGEPAIISGAVVVPTFVPPVGGTCQQFGDAYLYAFDPITGDPRSVLQDPANPTQFRPVVRLAGVGALSDLVVVNGRIYYATTRGGVGSNTPLQTGSGGRVQGWRRVR